MSRIILVEISLVMQIILLVNALKRNERLMHFPIFNFVSAYIMVNAYSILASDIYNRVEFLSSLNYFLIAVFGILVIIYTMKNCVDLNFKGVQLSILFLVFIPWWRWIFIFLFFNPAIIYSIVATIKVCCSLKKVLSKKDRIDADK